MCSQSKAKLYIFRIFVLLCKWRFFFLYIGFSEMNE